MNRQHGVRRNCNLRIFNTAVVIVVKNAVAINMDIDTVLNHKLSVRTWDNTYQTGGVYVLITILQIPVVLLDIPVVHRLTMHVSVLCNVWVVSVTTLDAVDLESHVV